MDDSSLVGSVYTFRQSCYQCCGLARRRHSNLPLCQVASLDQLHREVRPARQIADIEDLHDVGMPHGGDGLCFPSKPLPLLLVGVGTGQRHFQSHQPAELHLPGAKNDAHATLSEHRFDFVPRHLWESLVHLQRIGLVRRNQQHFIEFRPRPANLSPAGADDRQQFRATDTNLLGSGVLVEQFVEKFSHSGIIRHFSIPRFLFGFAVEQLNDFAGARRQGGPRVEIAQLFGQQPQAPPLHGFGGDSQQLRGFAIGHPLDADEVKRLALVRWQVVDRLQHPPTV
jgi:hypothetical protein